MSDILPREIWKKIIKHINDFDTWRTARFVSRTWYAWVALDEEKLNEFVMRLNDGEQEWQELPNGMLHGDVISYHNGRRIKSIERYYLGKKCDISEYLFPCEKFLNDRYAVWVDKQIHLYENGKLSLVILLLTEQQYDNQNDYTVYCPEQGLVICLGPKNSNNIYVSGNLI